MVTLYTTPLSAMGRKVMALSHHLGLDAEIKLINVYHGEGRTPEYLAINPLGKVPTLVDGDFTLWESNAILQYLAEAHGNYRLTSREPRTRADIARWLFWEASQWLPAFHPVLAAFVGQHVLPQTDPSTPVEVNWNHEQFQAQAKLLDAHLCGRTFLVRDELTIADFSVAGMMMYVRPAGFPFHDFPGIAAWYERIEALDAWKATAAGPWKY